MIHKYVYLQPSASGNYLTSSLFKFHFRKILQVQMAEPFFFFHVKKVCLSVSGLCEVIRRANDRGSLLAQAAQTNCKLLARIMASISSNQSDGMNNSILKRA